MQYSPSVEYAGNSSMAQLWYCGEESVQEKQQAGMWRDRSASRQTAGKDRGTEQQTHVQMYGGHTEDNQKSRKPY